MSDKFKSKKKDEFAEVNDKRKRIACPDCCYYIDGRKEHYKDEEWNIVRHPIPGMQHRRRSSGSIYDIAGTNTPCHCSSGMAVSYGFKHSPSGQEEFPVNKNVKEFFEKYDPVKAREEEEKRDRDLAGIRQS